MYRENILCQIAAVTLLAGFLSETISLKIYRVITIICYKSPSESLL